MSRKIAVALAGVVAAGVLGTAGVAAATSDDSTPTPTAAASPSAPSTTGHNADKADKAGKAKHALRARGLHGEWVVKGKDGKPVTIVSVRGQVTAVGPTSITVKAEDGYTTTFTANADTKVKGADVTTLSDVKVGATGAMVGTKSGNTVTARGVLVHK